MRCNLFVSFSYVPVCYLPYDMRGMYHVSNITIPRKTPQFNHLGYVYTGPVRNGSGPIFGPDRPSVYTGRPERFQPGPAVLQVQYRIRSGPVPEWSRVNTWTGSKQFHVNRSRSGSVRFVTVPDRFRVNVALKCLWTKKFFSKIW